MEQLQFRVSSFLKDLIGRELITNEFVAVFELVKNSFDADAKHVKVIFENHYNSDDAKIIIWDDGIGMDLHDLKNKWLFVAHSSKRDGSEERDYRDKIKNRRVFAGAKGVGRFSCDRLGEHLNLLSIKKGNNVKIENLIVDWTSFEEDSNTEFVDIKVSHNTLPKSNYTNYAQGTILEITGLRDRWDRLKILALKKSLEKLVNPMQENDSDNFSIEIIAEDELLKDSSENESRNKVNGVVENVVFESLGLKTTQIQVSIVENGNIIQTTLIDRGVRIYTLKEVNPYNSLYNISISLFVLNRAGKMNFKKQMGVDSVEYGSVFLYKNGFRVYPFGEEGDDTLKIDRRKAQGFYRYLGTRDLIGRIEINGEESNLKESTSRDGGLIRNESYSNLIDLFYDKALKRLETYTVDIIKWGDERYDKVTGELIQPEIHPDDVQSEIIGIISNLTKAKNIIGIEYDDNFLQIYHSKQEKSVTQLAKNFTRIAENSNDPELVKQARAVERSVSQLKKAKSEAEIETSKVREEVIQSEKKIEQVSTENLFLKSDVSKDVKHLESLQHHITHTSSTISAFAIKAINALKNNEIEKTNTYLNQIILANKKIATLSNFVSKAKFDTMTNKIETDLIGFINEYIQNVYSLQHRDMVFNSILCNEKYIKHFVPIEVIIILDNLLNNSEKANAKNINISWVSNSDFVELHFKDDGIGISNENINKVFDYRFSTTKGGGLGLYHIKEIISKMNGSIEIDNKKTKGVEFIIKFKR